MIAQLLRFEWQFHVRKLTFWAATALMVFVAFVLIATGFGPRTVYVNSPYTVVYDSAMLSLLSVFVVMVFTAGAVLRDFEHRMAGIVFATPVGKFRYFLSRFGGMVLAAFTVMALALLVLMLAPLGVSLPAERLGPLQAHLYLWALGVIILPNLLFIGAVLFAVAVLGRSALLCYVAAVALYALYWVAAMLIDSPLMAGAAPATPEALARAALLDPLGLSAFFEQTRYWPPALRNTQLPYLTGNFLWNRLGWLAVTAGLLALVYRQFAFSEKAARAPKATTRTADPAPALVYTPLPPVRDSSAGVLVRALLKQELRQLGGWILFALLLLWAFVVGMECVGQLTGEYGTPQLPTTARMLDAIQLPLSLFGTVVVVYYSAEICWRERLTGIAPLLDATPASDVWRYLAKLAALAALPLLLAVVGILTAVGVQLVLGYTRLDVPAYLSLLWFGVYPLVLFAVGALTLQLLLPNRWLGLFAGLVLALLASQASSLGLEHPLWSYGKGPTAGYSEMDGFGPLPLTFAAFMLYWSLLTVALAAIGWALWPRGPQAPVLQRFRNLSRQLGGRGRLLVYSGLTGFVLVGCWLYWQTSVHHTWYSTPAATQWRADYEHGYRRFHARPLPIGTHVQLVLRLEPALRRAETKGNMLLRNSTTLPLDTLLVTLPQGIDSAGIGLSGARLVHHDARLGVWLFVADSLWQPGTFRTLSWTFVLDRGGIQLDPAFDITANGTYLSENALVPNLGYQPGFELSRPDFRQRYGLTQPRTERAQLPSDSAQRALLAGAPHLRPWRTFQLDVIAPADQQVVATGLLVRKYSTEGYTLSRFRSNGRITPPLSVAAARYAQRHQRVDGVDVRIYYHPAHEANVARMMTAAARSLTLFSKQWGRYPHSQLTIAEVPSWAGFAAYATTGTIFFTEDRGFTAAAETSEVDLIGRRVAHEIAHQWWGHQLDPADVVGATTLVESLAKYAEQRYLHEVYGPSALAPMLAFDEDRYFLGRAREGEDEVPLLATTNDAYLYYGKGAIVMNGVAQTLGYAKTDSLLRQLLHRYGGPDGKATMLDFRDLLLARARTAADSTRFTDWLSGRSVTDYRVDTVQVMRLSDGRYQVQARISAQTWSSAEAAPIPLVDDSVAVALLAADGKPLYTARYHLQQGALLVTHTLPTPPHALHVDPAYTRLDPSRRNNLRTVE